MAAPIVVPDASVLLKWVLPSDNEPDADKALELMEAIAEERIRACLPSLWLYEVGNTIARRFPARAESWLGALIKFEIEEAAPSSKWLAAAFGLTRDFDVTFYDAAYHAVALVHRGIFVTADDHYFQRAGKAGSVSLLCDWTPP